MCLARAKMPPVPVRVYTFGTFNSQNWLNAQHLQIIAQLEPRNIVVARPNKLKNIHTTATTAMAAAVIAASAIAVFHNEESEFKNAEKI